MSEPITLKISKRFNLEDTGEWRLRMWVSEASDNIDPNVFVWQKKPVVPDDRQPVNIFVHVASYADQIAFPANTPDTYAPFFRKTFFDLVSSDKAVLEDTNRLVLKHLDQLVQEITRILQLPVQNVVEVIV